MSNIRNVKIITTVGTKRVVSGDYLIEGSFPVVIEFYQNDLCKGRTAANVVQKKFGARPLELERGLYELHFKRVLELKGPDGKPGFDEAEVYQEPVMAGDKYRVEIQKSKAVMYGENGTLVQVCCDELLLGNHGLYYRIRKTDPQLSRIKYWVSMEEGNSVRFFVKGAETEEVEFPSAQNDCLKSGEV